MPGPRHSGQKTVKETTRAVSGQSRTVYVLDPKGNAVKRDVKTGMTDGTMTEILSGDLKVGDKVIGISNITDHTTLLPTTDFEATITLNNQIQQVNASDLSAKTLVFFLGARS
jgi:hypothetical protein